MIVYTGQIFKYKEYRDKQYIPIDITVKNGHIVAPTWDMVRKYKDGLLTADEYTQQYIQILLSIPIKDLSSLCNDNIVLMCYCKPLVFCHRIILANYLQNMFIDVEYGGEI
jgi:uncharacterized protein YeaO (DUF488 family)